MTGPLFFAETLPDTGSTFTLTGSEAHHASASRRLHPNDTLWLFDGQGRIARGTLLRTLNRGRELELKIEEIQSVPAPQTTLHLACALPKGDRQNVLLDMATQLGMSRFTPLACERSVVLPGANSAARWRKICLEACKQSRRVFLPQIDDPISPQDLAKASILNGNSVWMAHPDAAITARQAAAEESGRSIALLIGPEGGFTDLEREQITAAGAKVLNLGQGILRTEAAAVALLAIFSRAK